MNNFGEKVSLLIIGKSKRILSRYLYYFINTALISAAVTGRIEVREAAGLRNFFVLYRPLSDTWQVYDNSGSSAPRPIARGRLGRITTITNQAVWNRIEGGGRRATEKNKGH